MIFPTELSSRDTDGVDTAIGESQSRESSVADSAVKSFTANQATASIEKMLDACDSPVLPELRHPTLKQYPEEDNLSVEFLSMVITEPQQPRPLSDPLPQRGSNFESVTDTSQEKEDSKRKPARPASTPECEHHIPEVRVKAYAQSFKTFDNFLMEWDV